VSCSRKGKTKKTSRRPRTTVNRQPKPEPAKEKKPLSAKKALRKERRRKHKLLMQNARDTAGAFPMVKMIDEQVRSSVPPPIVDLVKSSKKKDILSSNYPYDFLMDAEAYEEESSLLAIELVKMQSWVKESGERIVIIFGGRDAAGKGGTIKRFTENLNPRGARIVALSKPSETEGGQWYYQRYIEELPTRGEIVLCDRSWYNRAGVEYVMGFCSGHD
jgi:hypothetical protein